VITVLAVHERSSGRVLEYRTVARADHPDLASYAAAIRETDAALRAQHRGEGSDLEVFEGGAEDIDTFFRWFSHLRRPDTDPT